MKQVLKVVVFSLSVVSFTFAFTACQQNVEYPTYEENDISADNETQDDRHAYNQDVFTGNGSTLSTAKHGSSSSSKNK